MTEPATNPYRPPADAPLPAPVDPYAQAPFSTVPAYNQPTPAPPATYAEPAYAEPPYVAQPTYAQPPTYGQPSAAGPEPTYAQQPGPAYLPVPYGYPAYDPVTGAPMSDKSKVVAGVLGIVLGAFGAGRFYTGHTRIAIAQIAVTWLTCGLGHIWPLIDGIILLVQGGTDAQGRVLRQ